MICGIVLGLLLATSPVLAQDAAQLGDARDRADEARRKCASLIAGMDGLSTIGMAGVGTDYKLLLVVRDTAAKRAVQARLGGDECDGLKIVWSVKNSAPELRPPAPTVADPDPAAAANPADDTSQLDYWRRRDPTRIWTYTPPGWRRPWIVWEYNNGWNGHKLRARQYFWGVWR